jgi:hypothetical protein
MLGGVLPVWIWLYPAKRDDRVCGLRQLRIRPWTNGDDRFCFAKRTTKTAHPFEEIIDLPGGPVRVGVAVVLPCGERCPEQRFLRVGEAHQGGVVDPGISPT